MAPSYPTMLTAFFMSLAIIIIVLPGLPHLIRCGSAMFMLLIVIGAVAGCYDTPSPPCAFLCTQSGECPEDYRCVAEDGWCKRNDVAENFDCGGDFGDGDESAGTFPDQTADLSTPSPAMSPMRDICAPTVQSPAGCDTPRPILWPIPLCEASAS